MYMDTASEQIESEQVQSDQSITERDISCSMNVIEVIPEQQSTALASLTATTPTLVQVPQQLENLKIDGSQRDNERNEDGFFNTMEYEFSEFTEEFAQVSLCSKFAGDPKSTENGDSLQRDSDGELDSITKGTRDLTEISKHLNTYATNSVLESHTLDLRFKKLKYTQGRNQANFRKQSIITENRLEPSVSLSRTTGPSISQSGRIKGRPRRLIIQPEPSKIRPRRIVKQPGTIEIRPRSTKIRTEPQKPGPTETRSRHTASSKWRSGPTKSRPPRRIMKQAVQTKSRPRRIIMQTVPTGSQPGATKNRPGLTERRPRPTKRPFGATQTEPTESRPQTTESRSRTTESRLQTTEGRSRTIEKRSQATECRSRATKSRSRATENRPRATKSRPRTTKWRPEPNRQLGPITTRSRKHNGRHVPFSSRPDTNSSQPGLSSNQPDLTHSQPGPSCSQPGLSSKQSDSSSNPLGISSIRNASRSLPGSLSCQLDQFSNRPGTNNPPCQSSSQAVPSSSQHRSFSKPKLFSTVGQTEGLPESIDDILFPFESLHLRAKSRPEPIDTTNELTDSLPVLTKPLYRRSGRFGLESSQPDSSKNQRDSIKTQPDLTNNKPASPSCQPGAFSFEPGLSVCEPGPSNSIPSTRCKLQESEFGRLTGGEGTLSKNNCPIRDIPSMGNVVRHLCVDEEETIDYHLCQLIESCEKVDEYLEATTTTKDFILQSKNRFAELMMMKEISMDLLNTFNRCLSELQKVDALLKRMASEAGRHIDSCKEIIDRIVEMDTNGHTVFSELAPPESIFLKETARNHLRELDEPLEALQRAMQISKLRYDIYTSIKRLVASLWDL